MGATRDAYTDIKLDRSGVGHLVAKEYNYLIDGRSYDQSIREWFFIDDYVQAIDRDANGNQRSKGFIGVVAVDANGNAVTDNGRHHNLSTRGGCMDIKKNGVSFRMLNDGGLNTMPDATLTIIRNWANYVRGTLTVRSAYYANTSNYGMKYLNNNGSWQARNYGTLGAKTSITKEFTADPDRNSYAQMNFVAFGTNEEGTYEKSYPVNLMVRIWHQDAAVINGYQNPEVVRYIHAYLYEAEYNGLSSAPTGNVTAPARIYSDDGLSNVVANSWVRISDVAYRTEDAGFVVEKQNVSNGGSGISMFTVELERYRDYIPTRGVDPGTGGESGEIRAMYRWKYFGSIDLSSSHTFYIKPLLWSPYEEVEYNEEIALTITPSNRSATVWGEVEIDQYSPEFINLQNYFSKAKIVSVSPPLDISSINTPNREIRP